MNDKDPALKKSRIRLLPIYAVFCVGFLVVVGRAWNLQITDNERLDRLATSQYTAKLVSQPKRGTIYDRHGEVLAMDIRVSSVGIHPHKITDRIAVKQALLEHAGLKESDIDALLDSQKKFEWVARRIPKVNGDAIGARKFAGVQVTDEFRRYYPHRDLAGQVLGAVGYDAKALGGLELSFDPFLRSGPKTSAVERDARGRLITPQYKPEISYDLHLTLDRSIQSITDQVLSETAIHHDVQSAFAIVMDPASGEILAMSNYPAFDPNRYWKYPQDTWKNHALIDTFEPGSTFKTITVGAALASGRVEMKDTFHCENGAYGIGKNVIHDHGSYGTLDVKTILQKSSNIGVTKIAMKTGAKTFYDFMKLMGFGEKTDIGFIGEETGILRNYKNWQAIEFSNIAFGQGITVTGIQMATAYGAIANGGVRMDPVLVKSVRDSKGQSVVENKSDAGRMLMDDPSSQDLKTMLLSVTQTGGTATVAHIDGYLAAGKTGTAQKVNPKTHSYQPGEFVSSFIGMAPAKNPRLIVYVVLDTPRKNGYYGGVAAAPAFKKITEQALTYLGVAPTEDFASNTEKKTSPTNPSAKITDKKTPPPTAPPQDLSLEDFSKLSDWLVTQATDSLGKGVVPDLRGLSLRRVLQLTRGRKIKLKPRGSGIVLKQSVAPGQPLGSGQVIEIELGGQS